MIKFRIYGIEFVNYVEELIKLQKYGGQCKLSMLYS